MMWLIYSFCIKKYFQIKDMSPLHTRAGFKEIYIFGFLACNRYFNNYNNYFSYLKPIVMISLLMTSTKLKVNIWNPSKEIIVGFNCITFIVTALTIS